MQSASVHSANPAENRSHCMSSFLPPAYELPMFPVSIATWNTTALHATTHNSQKTARDRWRIVGQLLDSSGVVCLQETHGHSGDHGSFKATFPGIQAYSSFCDKPSAGGVAILLNPTMSNQFPAGLCETEIVPGRIRGVRGTSAQGAVITIVTVHLVPEWTLEYKKAMLRRVHAYCSEADAGTCFLGGDLNFLSFGEVRNDIENNTVFVGDNVLAEFFADQFSEWAELAQEYPTRRQITAEGKITSTSRIDRLYVRMAAHELEDRCPRAGCWHNLHKPGFPSDHMPVFGRIGSPMLLPPQRPSVPAWVAKHDDYQRLLAAEVAVLLLLAVRQHHHVPLELPVLLDCLQELMTIFSVTKVIIARE